MKNINKVVKNKRCLSCGLCSSICPVQAIKMKYNENRGFFEPEIDEQKCICCAKCVKNCPSGDLGGNAFLGDSLFQVLARATNKDVRYGSTSGGVINALVSFVIKEKIVDAVIMVEKNDESIIESSAIVITIDNIDDLSISPRNYASRYVSVPLLECFIDVKNRYERIAVVGTPCQIRAVKNVSNDVLTLGVTCSGGLSYLATEHYKSINKLAEAQMYYRGNGWPGMNSLVGKTQTVEAKHTGSYFEKMFSSQIFKNHACRYCKDHFAELADISFCDYWSSEELSQEMIGNSCVIVRSENGRKIFERALNAGDIVISRDLSRMDVIKTQQGPLKIKKTNIKQNISYKLFLSLIDIIFKLKLYKYFNYKVYSKIVWIHSKILNQVEFTVSDL